MNITEQQGFEHLFVAKKLGIGEHFNFDFAFEALGDKFLELVGHLTLWGIFRHHMGKI